MEIDEKTPQAQFLSLKDLEQKMIDFRHRFDTHADSDNWRMQPRSPWMRL
jgi:hypothetical protein